MNHVYILDSNRDISFSSLLMNEISSRGLRFSNMKETHVVDPKHNVLIYIPRVNYCRCVFDDLEYFGKYKLFGFNYIFILTTNTEDYEEIKPYLNLTIPNKRFRYYQTLSFDTFISRILINDCSRIFTRISKKR